MMDDKRIKELLFARSEIALDEISRKYGRLYRSVIREQLSNESDVEECANDVLVAIWESIPPNDPVQLSAYVCAVARRVAINRYKYNTRQKRNAEQTVMLSELGDCIPTRSGERMDLQAREITRVLNLFLEGLDAETRVLFVRRYVYGESVMSLAARFERKENSISVKLLRARRQLKKLLRKEGIGL